MISADFAGKRALVTGGASGIGLATTQALARCGARVAVNYLSGDSEAIETITRLKVTFPDIVMAPGDISRADTAAAMVNGAISELGGLDILINNAGTAGTRDPIPFHDLEAMTEVLWHNIIATNLMGPFHCTRSAASALTASRGCIVNTASMAALGGKASSLAYACSKAGLVNLTLNLSRALAPDIRVNAVAPGLVRTAWTDNWPTERKQNSIASTALKRIVEPEDVADAMVFLCAQGAITGQTIVVDCGRMA